MLKTRTESVGVEHPIAQGGLQWVGRTARLRALGYGRGSLRVLRSEKI